MTVRRPVLPSSPSPPCAVLAAGCGGSDEGGAKPPPGVSKKDFTKLLAEASTPTAADFPATEGKSLQQMAPGVKAGPQVGFATSRAHPGDEPPRVRDDRQGQQLRLRQERGLHRRSRRRTRHRRRTRRPADSLLTKPAFRSQNAAVDTSPIAQIYAASVPFPKTGTWNVLAVTKQGDGAMVGAPAR